MYVSALNNSNSTENRLMVEKKHLASCHTFVYDEVILGIINYHCEMFVFEVGKVANRNHEQELITETIHYLFYTVYVCSLHDD